MSQAPSNENATLSLANQSGRKHNVLDELSIDGKVDVTVDVTVDVKLQDNGGATSLLRASSEGNVMDIVQSLSNPDEVVGANHGDNARELRRSDILPPCSKPVELCVKYITHHMTTILLGTGAFGNAYLGEDRALATKFVVQEITFTRNDQTAIDEIRTGFQQEISVRPQFCWRLGIFDIILHLTKHLIVRLSLSLHLTIRTLFPCTVTL